MNEELKQKAKEYADKQIGCGDGYYEWTDIVQAYIAGATGETKKLQEQIENMKAELHHRLVSPSRGDSDCLDKIIGLDRLWQFGQEF